MTTHWVWKPQALKPRSQGPGLATLLSRDVTNIGFGGIAPGSAAEAAVAAARWTGGGGLLRAGTRDHSRC